MSTMDATSAAADGLKVYAIRQISTGYFMPASSKKRGFSGDEPTAECVPRLFLKPTAAKAALRMWLQGRWVMGYTPDSEFSTERYDLELIEVEGRRADDMEIVELRLSPSTELTTRKSFNERIAELGLPQIAYRRRGDDWIAHLANDTRVWECGATREEAIGRLATRLGVAAEEAP